MKVWLNQPLDKGEIKYYAFYSDDQIQSPYMYNSPLSQAVGDYGKPASTRFSVYVSIAKGDLQITKEDENGNKVPDTSFLISHHDDMSDPIGTFTTGDNGMVHIPGLQAGIIYIQEIAVPDHLVLDAAIHSVSILGNQNISYTQQNKLKKGKVLLRKLDHDSKQMLSGAVYGIYDQNGKLLQEMTTRDDGDVESMYLYYGTYTIKEIKAPPNYVLSSEVYTIHIKEDEQCMQVAGMNHSVKGKIRLYKEGEVLIDMKKDARGNIKFIYEKRKLADAVFNIYAKDTIYTVDGKQNVIYKKDEMVDTITTNANGLGESKELPLGSYYVIEKKAPLGYILQNEKRDVTLAYKDQDTAIVYSDAGSFMNQRQKVSVRANKQDESDKSPLTGAEITLYANKDIMSIDGKVLVKKGEVLERIITDKRKDIEFNIDLPIDKSVKTKSLSQKQNDHKKVIKNNEATYYGDDTSMFYVAETKAPSGYTLLSPVINYVDTAYQGQNQPVMQFSYSYFNHKTKTAFLKIDRTNKEVLPGASLALYTVDGDLIETWVSTKDPHVIEGLKPQEYILRETKPAAGYVTAEELHFIVRDDMRVQNIVMEDDISIVEIHKTDENKKEMEGNKLELIDEKGTVVDTWTSSDKGHQIKKLCVGKTYIVRETKPRDGYASAEDISFIVKDISGLQIITMQNQPLHMNFRKVDENNQQLKDARLCVKDDSGQIVEEWMSDGSDHIITGLIEGNTYTYEEIKAPDGYAITKPITFIAKQKEMIIMKDELLQYQIQIVKIDEDQPDVYLKDARFTLYEDPSCTKELETVVTDNKGMAVMKGLHSAAYYIKEKQAPYGYERDDQVYTVTLNTNTCIRENNMYILTVKNKKIDVPVTGVSNSAILHLFLYSGCFLTALYIVKKTRKTLFN